VQANPLRTNPKFAPVKDATQAQFDAQLCATPALRKLCHDQSFKILF
jgi:hypothetical protein